MQAASPVALMADRKAEYLAVLTAAGASLDRLARSSETEIEAVARSFKSLAGQADTILKQAGAIVGRIENEGMGSVLGSVQSLCLTVKDFLGRRLEAATTILGTLREEEKLVRQLIPITRSQEAIARHLSALSVLTNVEVAHLGGRGGNFHRLAQELASFSRLLTQQTLEMARDTERRQQTIALTRNELACSLPRLRGEMTGMEEDIENTLRVIEEELSQQAEVPGQFRQCAEHTAQQTAGVVAAIQAHDITRQQMEHVQQALGLIASKVSAAGSSGANELAAAHAGLRIQVLQLKTVRETVVNWTSQIRRCMEGIQQLSASGVAGIGPTVLRQEERLSAELAHIEMLQQKSQEYSGRMQATLGGLSSLVELVNTHLQRGQMIRNRLQILMLNALVEAQRLGRRGAVVSAIAALIKEVSEEWNTIGKRSRRALTEILGQVQHTNALMEAFSEASFQKLRSDQSETRAALDRVRRAAAFVADEAAQMLSITQSMQAHLAEVAATGTRLELCFDHLDIALGQTEGLAREWENDQAIAAEQCDTAEVECWLSSLYTTEVERAVMQAALHGTALPVVEHSFAGNAVELF
jgi:hypothetical protein